MASTMAELFMIAEPSNGTCITLGEPFTVQMEQPVCHPFGA